MSWIEIGKGYNILAPNVFTPNGDLVNDRFKAILSGFAEVHFSIYDSYGNLLYVEQVAEENPLEKLEGITLLGWDGANANGSPYYIYVIDGTLLDGETKIERSGVFSILK